MENTLNIEDIKGRIKSIHLLLLKKNTNFSNGLEPLKAYIKNDIFDDIKKIYIKPLESIFSNCELENFSYDSSLDGAIPFLSTSELTHSSVFSSLLNSISSIDSIKSLKTFENTLSESYLYAFIFTLDDSKTFTVVRKIYALNYLKNKGLLTFKDSRLNFIQDDLFALDPKIDCIIYDNSVYVTGKHNFETMFSYNYHYTTKATITLDSIKSSNILSNFDEFKLDCLDRSTITRKLAELCVHGDINIFIDKLKNNSKSIEKTIEKYNLDISLKDNKIVYSDVSSLSEIINLISDNYFKGDITNDIYLARGKSRLSSGKSNPKKRTTTKKRKSRKSN